MPHKLPHQWTRYIIESFEDVQSVAVRITRHSVGVEVISTTNVRLYHGFTEDTTPQAESDLLERAYHFLATRGIST